MQVEFKFKAISFYSVFLVLVLLGVYLRLDQFSLQVLLDDEWHAIHQLLKKTPGELFLTYGHADFSIPLALLYWVELKLIGLSESGMRSPMLLAGLFTLIVFPLYIKKYFGEKITLLFTALLAVSPMLLIYSRTARPYAITLLLSSICIGVFHKFVKAEKSSFRLGLVFVLCAVITVWLHLITLAMVIAPFLVYGLPALKDRNWRRVKRIFLLGLITLTALLIVVLPPLMGHHEALSVKLGVQTPALATLYGALYIWLGTSSPTVVLVGLLLTALGAKSLWRDFPLTPSLILGLVLTCAIILLSQPAWVNHSLTFARYLLPAIPLLLLSISIGAFRAGEALVQRLGNNSGRYIFFTASILLLLLVAYHSPLQKILANPNSNSLHSVYQFDFRDEKNLIMLYQQDFPVSPFWQRLASLPHDSIKIAASPFSFETHHWDAPRWEQISHQRVMPGFLTGFCIDQRWGEVPRGQEFRFKNAGYLSDKSDLIARKFDLVVYQKPFTVLTNQGEREFGRETMGCESKIRTEFPSPVYEDQWLVVIPLSEAIRRRLDATR